MTLAAENSQILNLVRALLGSVSDNFRAVSLSTTDDAVKLQFILCADDEEDREEIEDIVFEFEALQDHGIDVEVEIRIEASPIAELKFLDRIVFLRKEAT